MNTPFVIAIKKSGFSVEELSGLTGIPSVFIYRIAREDQEPSKRFAETFSEILEKPVTELFPGYEDK